MRILFCFWLVVFYVAAVCAASTSAQENDFWINPSGGLYIDFVNWGDETSPGAMDTANFDLNALYDVDWIDAYAPVAELNISSGNVLFRSLGSDTGGPVFQYQVLGDTNVSANTTFFVGFGNEGHHLSVGNNLNVGDGRMDVLANSILSVGGTTTINSGATFSIGDSVMDTIGEIFFDDGNAGGAVGATNVEVENGGLLSSDAFIDVGSGDGSLVFMEVDDSSTVFDTLGAYIGAFAGSNGELTVRDPGSQWVSGDRFRVGWEGSGVLNIENSGLVSADEIIIGDLESSNGTVNLTDAGSTLSAIDLIEVGGSGTGLLNIRNEATVTTDGPIIIGETGEIDVNQPGLSAEITAAGGIVNHGLIDLQIGSPTINGLVHNFGTIQSTSGSVARIEGSIQHDGTEIFISSSSSVRVSGNASGVGPYTGTGTAQFNAFVKPGMGTGDVQIGTMQFEGNVRLTDAAFLAIEIEGKLPGKFDRLVIEGNAEIDGDFVPFDLGHDFVAGDEFVFVEIGGVRTGEFIGLPEGALVSSIDGVDFFITYGGGDGNDIALFSDGSPILLGDINLDGVVNLLDVGPFVALISNGEFQAEGDINGDGAVNLLDVGGFIDLLAG